MRMFAKIATLAVAATLFVAPAFAVEPGAAAPDFTVKDQDGKEHKLADFKDKVLVLQWTHPGSPTATDDSKKGGCPFVTGRDEAGTFKNLAAKVKEAGAVFAQVNSTNWNTAEDSKEISKKFGYDFPVIQDADGKLGQAYGAKTTPHIIVIGKDGKVVYNGALNDNKSPDASKDAAAKDYVLPAVQAALKGEKPEVSSTTPYGCSVKFAKK